jgi:hypothetical protein
VDRHQPVMEADGDLVGRIGLVLDPVLSIVEQHAEIGRDLPGLDANTALGGAKLPCPAPDISVHALVQRADEILGENVVARARVKLDLDQ